MSYFQLSKKAEQDLKEIYQYSYRQYGERQADKYICELEKTFYFLAENPLICPEHVEFKPPVRIHHHDKHLVVYTPNVRFFGFTVGENIVKRAGD